LVTIEEVAGSRTRLTIANLLSSRPRTLGELAAETGISVQGVLKHLKKLSEAGLTLKERTIPNGAYLRSRKLYFIEETKVVDFSQGDLLVAATRRRPVSDPHGTTTGGGEGGDQAEELDRLAQDMIIVRRRVREVSKRLDRMISEVVEDEALIMSLIESLDLDPGERQIAYLIFGDDSPEGVRRILREHYGCADPDMAINRVTLRLKKEEAGPR
jgi:DNA-binding transcriptional ArsR family regulator